MHESFALSYRTFDKLRSIHRPEVVENKRLDDVLSIVAGCRPGVNCSAARAARDGA
ncbi:hypothetical protein FHT69_002984 [Rhizobium sp. BK008]|nr:hypothetical protein [Rhizobium sp. BK008]